MVDDDTATAGAGAADPGATAGCIRPIRPADDATVARIIRSVLASFGCTGPGFAYGDPEVAAMSAAYPGGQACYYVVELGGKVLGGGGFGPLAGSDPRLRIAELRKMYFLSTLRGRGTGRRLLSTLIEEMRSIGYRQVYLETTTQMTAARALYRSFGFRRLEAGMGATGHSACDQRLLLDL